MYCRCWFTKKSHNVLEELSRSGGIWKMWIGDVSWVWRRVLIWNVAHLYSLEMLPGPLSYSSTWCLSSLVLCRKQWPWSWQDYLQKAIRSKGLFQRGKLPPRTRLHLQPHHPPSTGLLNPSPMSFQQDVQTVKLAAVHLPVWGENGLVWRRNK